MFKENYLNYILDQLSELENFTFKKMLGGIGFFRDELLFGIILGGKFRLKITTPCGPCEDETTSYVIPQIIEQNFCTVPNEVIQNKKSLRSWTEKAIKMALKEGNL